MRERYHPIEYSDMGSPTDFDVEDQDCDEEDRNCPEEVIDIGGTRETRKASVV